MPKLPSHYCYISINTLLCKRSHDVVQKFTKLSASEWARIIHLDIAFIKCKNMHITCALEILICIILKGLHENDVTNER